MSDPSTTEASPDARPFRVLLVHDEYSIVEVWRQVLAPECELSLVSSVDKVNLVLDGSAEPDLLLIDVTPYAGKGSVAHHALMAHAVSLRVPIVVVVESEDNAESNALSRGAADVLPQPFSFVAAKLRILRQIRSNLGPRAATTNAAVTTPGVGGDVALGALPPAFMAMLEAYPDGLLFSNAQGRILGFSREFCSQWDVRPQQLLAWGLQELSAHMGQCLHADNFSDPAMTQKASFLGGVHGDVLTRQGRWLRRLFLDVRLPGTQPMQMMCWRDVSEVHLLQMRALDQFVDGLMSSDLPYQLYFKDRQSRFTRVNQALAKRLGLQDPSRAIGRSDEDYHAPVHAAQTRHEEKIILDSGRPLVGALHLETWQDGHKQWNMSSKVPWRNTAGQIIGLFGISHDITVDKDRQQAIRDLESFTKNVEHDLRAPLRAIEGFSQLLLTHQRDLLDSVSTNYLQRIRGATLQMNQLMQDISRLVRLPRDQLQRSDVDLSALVQQVAAQLADAWRDHQVKLTIAPGMRVQADAGLLKLALLNLLSNAWKFSSKVQQPEIAVGYEQRDGQTWFFVRDNGAGFDMAHVDQLFGEFQRLHSQHEFTGSGIGLAIVQRVIEKHGGTIKAKGEVNKGAAFYFTLEAGPGTQVR